MEFLMNASSNVQVSDASTPASTSTQQKLGKTEKRRIKEAQRQEQSGVGVKLPRLFENLEDCSARIDRAIAANIAWVQNNSLEKGIVLDNVDPFRPAILALSWGLGIVRLMEAMVPGVYTQEFVDDMKVHIEARLEMAFEQKTDRAEEAMEMFVSILEEKGEYHPVAAKAALNLVRDTISPPKEGEQSSSDGSKPAFTVEKIIKVFEAAMRNDHENEDDSMEKSFGTLRWMAFVVRDDARISEKGSLMQTIVRLYAELISGGQPSDEDTQEAEKWLEETLTVSQNGQAERKPAPFTIEKVCALFAQNQNLGLLIWMTQVIRDDARISAEERVALYEQIIELNVQFMNAPHGLLSEVPRLTIDARKWLAAVLKSKPQFRPQGSRPQQQGGNAPMHSAKPVELKVTPPKAPPVDLAKLSPEERKKEIERRREEDAKQALAAKQERINKRLEEDKKRQNKDFGVQTQVVAKKSDDGGKKGKNGKKGKGGDAQQPKKGR